MHMIQPTQGLVTTDIPRDIPPYSKSSHIRLNTQIPSQKSVWVPMTIHQTGGVHDSTFIRFS